MAVKRKQSIKKQSATKRASVPSKKQSARKEVAISRKKALGNKKQSAKKKAVSQRKTSKSRIQKTIDFHYLKGPDFRSVHVDGAIGGITTKGFLHIALFTERAAIPQQTTYKIMPDGTLGDEIVERRKSKGGVVRQMEVDLLVNEDTAIVLRNWLDQRIEEFEERRKEIAALRKGD